MNSILLSIEKGIASITLNRPKSFNSFNREMALGLQNALDICHSDDSIRAVVISGEGKAFCAGQDLVEVTDQAQTRPLGAVRVWRSTGGSVLVHTCQ